MAEIKTESDIKPETKDCTDNAEPVKSENGTETKETNAVKVENGTESANGTAEMSEEEREAKIVRQVEYYFGNYNLPKDKFLQEQIKLEDGWIPLEVMLRFKRLAALSSDHEVIGKSLKNSSKFMEVSEDGTKIRRSPENPLPEITPEYQKLLSERTVYVKGFPQAESTMDMLLDFFKPHGIENLMMRRYLDKSTKKYLFKGSVYVVFETKEAAEKFLALETVTYNDTELIRLTQSAHVEVKKKEKDERWGKKVKTDKKEDDKGKKDFPKGCILHVTGIVDEEISREVLKEKLVGLGAEVAFIKFDRGDKEASVRLMSTDDGAAAKFIQTLEEGNQKLMLGENEASLKPLEGEEEEKFLENTRQHFQRFQKGGNRRGGKRGGGRGNFRGHKRSGGNMDGAPPAKVPATS